MRFFDIHNSLVPRSWNGAARCLLSLLTCCLLTVAAWGQEAEQAIKSPDRSSPRAVLKPLDRSSPRAAETQVQSWRDEGRLPFPDFAPEQKDQLRGSLVYPPEGSLGSG